MCQRRKLRTGHFGLPIERILIRQELALCEAQVHFGLLQVQFSRTQLAAICAPRPYRNGELSLRRRPQISFVMTIIDSKLIGVDAVEVVERKGGQKGAARYAHPV